MLSNPLSPTLYDLLVRRFSSVEISNEGCPAYLQREPDPFRPNRTVQQAAAWGEYYRVCCPFCDDRRHRLWINHLYGSEVVFGRRQFTNLAICYNEQCLTQPGRFEQLEQMIFGLGPHMRPRNLPVRTTVEPYVHKPVVPPGVIVPLKDLPPDHEARQYLLSRNFIPEQLSANFGVGVVAEIAEDASPANKGRLYIPVYQNSELVGWQCRGIHSAQKPKYLNAPTMHKAGLLYNYDTAKDQPFVIVVEGVPSVWRLGAAAVCLFGKSMSLTQHNLIARTWHSKPVFLMLDHDAKREMDHATTLLRRTLSKVIPVELPDARDPADYSFMDITNLVFARAEAEGVLSSMV